MRKTALFMACCIGLLFFASCNKEIQPTISIATGANYAGQNTEMFAGDQITVGFSVTGENLTNIEVKVLQNGAVLYTDSQSIGNEASYLYAHNFTIDAIGTVTVSGIVTDAKGHTAMSSFDIFCYEKPNAKFVGQYEGDVLVSGTFNASITGMDPMQQVLENEPISSQLSVVAGNDINEVIAHVTIGDQESTALGTVEGNKVVFEAINTPYVMNYNYNGMNIPITLDMTYNITGTLNDGKLDLSGDCSGNGDFNLFIVSGTIEMEGTVGGSLNKTE